MNTLIDHPNTINRFLEMEVAPTRSESKNKTSVEARSPSAEYGRTIYFGSIHNYFSYAIVPQAKSNIFRDLRKFSRKIFNLPPKPETDITEETDLSPVFFFNDQLLKNDVSSSRYNVLNFLPLQLIFQFSKLANAYFLLISMLQVFTDWSPTGKYTTLAPLVLFVSLAMLREAYDDYNRHHQDDKDNKASIRKLQLKYKHSDKIDDGKFRPSKELMSSPPLSNVDQKSWTKQAQSCSSVQDSAWIDVHWASLRVGDIVLVNQNETFPADLFLLSSSNDDGSCFIETSSLDGETNLKQKMALKGTKHYKQEDVANIAGTYPVHSVLILISHLGCIKAEVPNADLYRFDGSIEITDALKCEKYPLTINQLLLRDSALRNTKYIIGVVVFAGEDTKIRNNAMMTTIAKSPAVEITTNKLVAAIFVLILVLMIICSYLGVQWNNSVGVSNPYYFLRPTDLISVVALTFSFLILYNTMIPISLYVTMEFIKLVQAYLISTDLDMFDPVSSTFARPNTSSLNEDLGQVQYLFSDKTGTLTENIMIFRKFTAGGIKYDHEPHLKPDAKHHQSSTTSLNRAYRALCMEIESADSIMQLHAFVEGMALCHTAIPEKVETRGSEKIVYQASSPDEQSLVQAASELGYAMIQNVLGEVSLEIQAPFSLAPDGGSQQRSPIRKCKLLEVIEFTSSRKRMTTIYRFPDNRIVLFCKGADSIILPRLKQTFKNDAVTAAEQHVREFAAEGLRTLVYGRRILSEKEYSSWSDRYKEAATSITNRQEKMDCLSEEIENHLDFLGASGIEDKLQDGVPETLERLQIAGIRLWVLTGDKRETAINIGYSSNLIHTSSTVHIIDWQQFGGTDEYVRLALRNLHDSCKRNSDEQKQKSRDNNVHKVAVIDGDTLAQLEKSERHQKSNMTPSLLELFIELAILMDSVICCRVSPIQKALVVKCINEKFGAKTVTLAVGDGANDVAMIKEARVGVGISGREGVQAARASDYSISRFRFLQKLLLVHGRWSYVRVTKFTLGSFYKCIMFYLTQVFFQIYAGFSATSLYEQWTLSLFNVVFTSCAVVVLGIFDQDLDAKTLMDNPFLYEVGQKNMLYGLFEISRWFLSAVYQASVIFFLPFVFYELTGYSFINFNNDGGAYTLGCIIYTAVVLVVNLKITYIDLNYITVVNHVVCWLSFIFWIVHLFIVSNALPENNQTAYIMKGIIDQLFAGINFIFIVILISTIALLPDFLYLIISREFFSSKTDEFRLKERYGSKKNEEIPSPSLNA